MQKLAANIKRFICQNQKVDLRLTVSCSRAEHFIRIDLVDPTSVSDDRHKVAPSRKLMTSKVDHKYVTDCGPLVSVHSVRCSPSDPNSFTDKTRPVITLLAKYFGILPIDHMVILNSVVSNSWPRLFTFRLFSGLPCKIPSRGFHFFSLFLVFIQPGAEAPTRLYLWSTFDVINFLEGATLWRSSETEVGSTKSILMKCSAREHETVNRKSTFWFWQMNLFILFSYKPDEFLQGLLQMSIKSSINERSKCPLSTKVTTTSAKFVCSRRFIAINFQYCNQIHADGGSTVSVSSKGSWWVLFLCNKEQIRGFIQMR